MFRCICTFCPQAQPFLSPPPPSQLLGFSSSVSGTDQAEEASTWRSVSERAKERGSLWSHSAGEAYCARQQLGKVGHRDWLCLFHWSTWVKCPHKRRKLSSLKPVGARFWLMVASNKVLSITVSDTVNIVEKLISYRESDDFFHYILFLIDFQKA